VEPRGADEEGEPGPQGSSQYSFFPNENTTGKKEESPGRVMRRGRTGEAIGEKKKKGPAKRKKDWRVTQLGE